MKTHSRKATFLTIFSCLALAAAARSQTLLNIDFGVGSRSAKTGFAATGQGTNDVWNLYRHYDPKFVPGAPLVADGRMENLKLADGADSKVAVAVANAPGVWGNATGDPMYDTFIFAQNGSNITVTLTGLDPGRYHFYLYGHADPDVTGEQNSAFTLRCGTNTLAPAATLGSAGWKATQPWQERHQYVVFRDVPVLAGVPVVVDVAPGPNGVAVLNGLQVSSRGTSPPRLFVSPTTKPASELTNLLFHELRYDGKVSDTEARFTADLRVESMTTNEISAPLFEGDVAVIAPDLPAGLRITSTAKKYRLVATAAGNYRLKLDVVARITKAEPWNQVTFTGPDAAIASVSVQASAAGVEIQLLSDTQLNPDAKATSRMEGFLGADRVLSMRWQSKTAEVARKSLVNVDTLAAAQVTPTVIKYSTQFRYEILQAPLPRLRLAIPLRQNLTKLQGEQIRDWSVQTGPPTVISSEVMQIVTVEFIKPVEKAYTLTLLTEQPVETTPANSGLQPPQPLDLQRESGSFTVSADDMVVEIDTATGLRQVNAASGALAAYRFFGRPVSLTTRLKRIEPVVRATDRVTSRLEETRLLIAHALSLNVEKAGIYALELAPQPGFVVADVKGEGVDDWKLVDGAVAGSKVLRVSFGSRVLGARRLDVQLEQALKEFPSEFTVLPLRVTGATNETAQVGAAAALGIQLKTQGELAGLREVPISALSNRADEQLAFRADQADWRLTLSAERLPARVVAEVFNLVTVGDGLVGGSATLRYGLINQGVQEFRVTLPAHWKNVEFTGPNIRRKEVAASPAGADTNYVAWLLTLQDKVWGGYTLVVTYDYPFDPKRATLDLRGAHCAGVEREAGTMAVTVAASLKIEPRPIAEPLRSIDSSELAETDRALITRPVLLAYRYTGDAFALAADVTRFEELPVLDAVADRTQLTTVLNEAGEMLSQASFMVKNNDRQFQKFKLPAGAKFWSCTVNNQPAKAETDGDQLLVPLPRGANRDEAFAVDIVYVQKTEPLTARFWSQSIQLAAPQTDVPNTYAEWHLYVPSSQRLGDFAGNMTVARGTVYGLREAWDRFAEANREFFRDHGGTLVVFGGIAILLIVLIGGAMRQGAKGVVTALAVLAILAVLASMLLPALSKAKMRAQRVGGVSNLKQIALAARMWADDHGGVFPPSFEQMKNELGSEKILRDPESGEVFVYAGAGKRTDTPNAIIAYSPVDLRGRSVAFADGSVQIMTSAQFNEALQRDIQAASQFAAAAAQREVVARQQAFEQAAPNAPPVVNAPAMPPQQPAPQEMLAVGGMAGGGGAGGFGARTPAAGAAPTAVGLRSLRIEIPRSGQMLSFTKVLNVSDEPLSVKMSAVKNSWFERRRSALQLVTFLVGLIMAWLEWRREAVRTLRLTIGLALVIGAVTSLALAQRTLHLVLIAGVPALGLLLVGWLLWKFWPQKQSRIDAEAGPSPTTPPALAGFVLAMTLSLAGATATAQEAPQVAVADHALRVTNAFSILSATYTGTVSEKVAQFDATLAIATFATNQIVPLFADDVAVQDFTTKAPDSRLLRQGRSLALRLGESGNATVQFKVLVKLGGDGAKRQLAFAIPSALSSRLNMVLGEPDAEVEFPTAVAFQRAPSAKETRVEAVLGAGDRVEMTWTPRMKRATEMAASVFVENTALVTVGGGVVNTRSTLAYQITQGELRQVKVRLPAGQRLLRVDGEFVRTWELRDDAGAQVLSVDLVKSISPNYRLTVETERLLDRLPASVKVELPSAMDVIRETGAVGLKGTEELNLAVENTAELQRVDGAEFAKAGAVKVEELLSAYRFLKPGFVLSARAEAVQPQIDATVRNNFRIGFEDVSLRAQVDYGIKKVGVFTLRLGLPAGYRVESVAATDGGPKAREIQWAEKAEPRVLEVAFKERTLGAVSLTVVLAKPHRELPRTIELAGVQPIEVQKVTGFVSVSSEAGVAARATAFDGLTEIPAAALDLANPGARNGTSSVLAYKLVAADAQAAWKLSLTTETVESWVRAEIADVVSVSETLVTGRAIVRYDIANAPIKEFRLRIPAGYTNVEVLGPNIRRRDQSNGVWTVELQTKVRGLQQFTVTWEQPRPARTNTALAVAGIEALGVERETGFAVLLAKPPLQLQPAAPGEELVRIDVRELPEWAGVSTTLATPGGELPVLVYRYLRPGFRLAVEARRFEEAAVLQALVDEARLTTVVADDGQMMTELTLGIRNNGLQHLEIELPLRAKVWSAFVAGQPVRPTQRGGRLMLPLERSSSDAPVNVELTYVDADAFPKTSGRVNLASPKLDVPLKNARWEVYLPPDYDYAKFKGSMTHAASAEPAVLVFSSGEYQRQEVSKKQAQVSQVKSFLSKTRKGLSEGNVKDANWEFNNALRLNEGVTDEATRKEVEGLKRELGKVQGSNLIQAQRRYSVDNAFRYAQTTPQPAAQGQQVGEMVQYDADAAEQQVLALNRAQEVLVSRVQPLRANLPTRGVRHCFTQVLQTEVNKPMTIEFTARNAKEVGWFRQFSYGALAFVALWIVVAFVASQRGARRSPEMC